VLPYIRSSIPSLLEISLYAYQHILHGLRADNLTGRVTREVAQFFRTRGISS